MKRKLTENPHRPKTPGVADPTTELPVKEICILECQLVDGSWAEWARIILHSGSMWDGEKLAAFRPNCRTRFVEPEGR